jgi:penicillin-binding protein 1B
MGKTFNLKKIAKYFLIFLIAIMVFAIGYIVVVLTSIPFDKLRHYASSRIEMQQEKFVNFEEGALVQYNEWKNFHLFSSDPKKFKSVERNLIKDESISLIKEGILLEKSFKIHDLLANDCKDIFCFQKQLDFAEIPSVFWKGLIGIEDQRFLDHSGIDPKSLLRALITDIREMRFVQGGSTLTQQLVKNLFLTNEKTFSRKLKELIVSIYIERNFTKENILEAYFNEFVWGSLQGIRVKGIHAASLFYFEKRPEMVGPYEAAILISLLKGPNYYHPLRNLKRLKGRTNLVFKKLVELNLFSQKNTAVWGEKRWKRWQKRLSKLEKDKPFEAAWFTLSDQGSYLNNYEKYIFKSKVNKLLGDLKADLGNKDLSVKAIIGDISVEAKFKFYSKFERLKERAMTKEPHQLGSTVKPIIYRSFFNLGKTPEDIVLTEPITLELKSGDWTPTEAHTIDLPEVTLLTALQKSLNIPLIRTASELGFAEVEPLLKEFFPKLKSPLGEYPSQLLGAIELSMTGIYDLYEKFIKEECTKEENILFMLADPKLTTVSKSVGKYFSNLSFFGKTGTSNRGLDNWYVFFDGKSLGVIWVGLEGVRTDESLSIYGGTTAFQLFQGLYRDRGKRFNELSCDWASGSKALNF